MPLVLPHASVMLDPEMGQAAFDLDGCAPVALVHVGEDSLLHCISDQGRSEGEFSDTR